MKGGNSPEEIRSKRLVVVFTPSKSIAHETILSLSLLLLLGVFSLPTAHHACVPPSFERLIFVLSKGLCPPICVAPFSQSFTMLFLAVSPI